MTGWDITFDYQSLIEGVSQSITQMASSKSPVELGEESALNPLGKDLLIFLCATIAIVPLFKYLKESPVIGFLSAGLLMGPAGLTLFTDLNDMETLADFGVLFLLFEQGLELTVDRLKSLSKYAFGMGTLQVLLSSLAFFLFPFVGGVKFLEIVFKSQPEVVDITRFDEALVIGAALSLSSSAFVLKILQEKGQLATRAGSAALGILLLQDIAVVPLLVLLPIIESNTGSMPLTEQLTILGLTFMKAIFGLGGILIFGGAFVRFLFSLIAKTKSSETFVALCLLVVVGTGALTDSFGLSSTLGAFTAGTLLAESNYRTQIEADIKPFRGLLLGLFFMTTGASVEPKIIQEQWPTVLGLLGGLIAFKSVIITALGPRFGLTLAESVKTGLVLSGGGEFAFVLLTLADKLKVIPDQLAKILVGVVVISMALTPTLSYIGDKAAEYVEEWERSRQYTSGSVDPMGSGSDVDCSDAVVICGYGLVGETVAKFLSVNSVLENLIATGANADITKYVAFDLDPDRVIQGNKMGHRVMYGDGSQPLVLRTAGITAPRAVVVTFDDDELCLKSVARLRSAFPTVPILSRVNDQEGLVEVLEAGATIAIPDEREASLQIASSLLQSLGVDTTDLRQLRVDNRELLLKQDEELVGQIQSYRQQKAESQSGIGDSPLAVIKSFKKQLKSIWSGTEGTMDAADDSELGVTVCKLPDRSERL